MRKSTIIIIFGSIAIVAGLSAVLMHWPSHNRPDAELLLEPEPVVLDVLRAEPARKQRLPLPWQPSGQAEPATVAPPPVVVDVAPEKPSAPAEKVLWAYQTDVCACDSTACIVELADRHTALLMSLRDFDPGNAGQKALIEDIKECIELVRAREQPVDFKTPAVLAAQRDQERREMMLRENDGPEGSRSQ
jgi:hypothetical protein